MKIKFTHKGWFGFCPVYFARLESSSPLVDPRHWTLTPLMIFSQWFYSAVFYCAARMNPNFEAEWPLTVTGQLVPPIEIEK